MLAMLSRFSTPRRPSLSLQLLRHFSIRVSSLKKQSLVAQILRGNRSPKLTTFTQKGGVFLDPRSNGAEVTQQGEASLRSVCKHSPLGVSVEPPVLENGRSQEQRLVEDDACIAKLSVRSKKDSKGLQRRDAVTKLSVCARREGSKAPHSDGDTQLSVLPKLSVPSLREGSKAHVHSDGDMQLSVLPKLSVPSLREGSKAHHIVGDTQPSVRAQTRRKRGSYDDGKLLQTERRKVDPAKISVQSQITGEEGHFSDGPVASKPGSRDGKSKLGISPLRTSSSKEISSSALQIGDEPGECLTGNVSPTERGEEDDEQKAIKHTVFLKKSVPSAGRETSKQSKVKIFVEVDSVILKQKITEKFLQNLQRKIELLNVESAPLTLVKALLTKRNFLFGSPENLAEVLTVLKLFFESGEKACQILKGNSKIIMQPLEQLQQRLQVLVEFEVDKATCYRLGTSPYMMALKVEKYRSVLSLLKGLGLSAESRNRMICKLPVIMRGSVEKQMQPNVNFLESIKIARPTLLKLLETRPATLCSNGKNLMALYKLFQHVGLSAKEFVKALKTMTHYPSTHSFSRYNFFREQGLSDAAFARMLQRYPNIVTMSEESLKAKLHFLLHTAKRDISEISVFPAYFGYSLARRIIPRFKILEESTNLHRRFSLSTLITLPTWKL